jgi:hypothetical protein
MFAIKHVDRRYHPKEWVLGVEVNRVFKAYPFSELRKLRALLSNEVNGRTTQIRFKPETTSATATDADGKPIPSVMAFWFAWYAFHPDMQVFRASP